MFPITETDSGKNIGVEETPSQSEGALPVVIRTASKIKNDSKDNKANDSQDLDGTGDAT